MALADLAGWDFAPATVAETHAGIVFFAGDRAYKLKKPVKFGFLDFSTETKRRSALERELELNSRISPEAYLDVVALVGSGGDIVDHMLIMKRMPADRSLANLARSGAEVDDCMAAIARKIAEFHGAAKTSAEISSIASPEALAANWQSNLEEIAPFAPDPLESASLDEVARLSSRYISGRAELLESRITAGCIKDGHGDLLAADIFCVEPGPAILDCIEFDDRLRWGDVISDLAFLAMDLERLGRDDMAQSLFSRYHEFSGETAPASLVDHYIALRALIRSKVACLRWKQGEASSREEAVQLLEMCAMHLMKSGIKMVLLGGRPGTGKSTLGAALSESVGWPLLRSDAIRKDLAGIGPGVAASADLGEGIYSPEWNRATYEAMLDQALRLTSLGESVILDASWSRESDRALARTTADASFTDIIELECRCPHDVALTRIQRRLASGKDPSDADEQVADAMDFDAWIEATDVETGGDVKDSLAAALDRIR